MTISGTFEFCKLSDSTITPGFRKMEFRDASIIACLLRNYLSQFVAAPDFDERDVGHFAFPN